MTRGELRLELLRIVHSATQAHALTLQIVHDYEKDFEGLIDSTPAELAERHAKAIEEMQASELSEIAKQRSAKSKAAG